MLVRYNDAGLSSLWNRERPLPVSRQKGFWVDLSKSLGIVFKILCCILWNALRCHLMDISFGKLVFIWIPWMWLFLCVCFTCCASSDCVCYSFCFHFCEPGMEKAWQQWRLWEIKTTWQGYENQWVICMMWETNGWINGRSLAPWMTPTAVTQQLCFQ